MTSPRGGRGTDDLFEGAGEVRALAREIDWSATPLGSTGSWSETLRTAVRTCLDAPFPINLWCGDDLVLIYNDGYRHVLGGKHPDALGRPGRQVWAEIWPDIHSMFDAIRAGGPAHYAEDAAFGVSREISPGDPLPKEPNAWFTFSLSPIREPGGKIVAFLNIVSDSTGRILAERAREAALSAAERAEARLRDVFTQAPAFLAVLRGKDLVFEYANAAYHRLVGDRELVGRSVWDALPEVRDQGFEGILNEVLRTGEPFVGREVPVFVSRTDSGEPERRFVDVVYYPIAEADGTRSGVVAHGSDVTDHVLARREAQRARAEAERANQAKSQFLANMSHEIRTPINAVIGYTDLLDAEIAGDLTPKQHEYVDRVRASSKHLLGLVNDILDLAKIEAGEMSIEPHACRVGPSVEAAIEMVAPQAAEGGLELVEEWECGESAVVHGDEDRIRQIVLNLLSNALKFTGDGGRITVRCRISEEPAEGSALAAGGPWVVLEVEDTGAGIEPDQLARIFDPFVQAEGGHTRRAAGTGLGLTISRRLARLMGGEITARSQPGVGSTFAVWLAAADQVLSPAVVAGWEERTQVPEGSQEVPGLGDVAHLLIGAADVLEAELVRRIQTDRTIPAAEGLSRAQLGDHTAPLIGVMAKALAALAEGGAGTDLLKDGREFQDLMAVGHGRQRRRVGWSPADLDREYEILRQLLDGYLRNEAPKHTAADIAGAIEIMHRILARARRTSIAGYAEVPEG